MRTTRQVNVAILIGMVFFASPVTADSASTPKKPRAAQAAEKGQKIFWEDPSATGRENLMYGQGGAKHQPAGTVFGFVEESSTGSTPKFKVVDSAGTKWKVKLGVEARPETVATRIVWAAGYTTDEDYFLSEIQVRNLPKHLHRGQNYVEPGGVVRNARLERDIPGYKHAGIWKWKQEPFSGTREWNGLRTLMALINNWDLKDVNNSIYAVKDAGDNAGDPHYLYVVSDLGATFGTVRLDMGRKHNKGELKSYSRSKFISKTETSSVSFATPGTPSLPILFNPKAFFSRQKMTWIAHDVPKQDARWMGSVLARLTPAQIRDAFRAGGYPPAEVEAFALIVERRIAALNAL